VRGDERSLVGTERVVGVRRLLGQDVDGCCGEVAVVECAQDGVLVDQAAARRVNEYGPFGHVAQRGVVDKVVRLVGEWQVEGKDVRDPEGLLDGSLLDGVGPVLGREWRLLRAYR
jgi:hypothetical protein